MPIYINIPGIPGDVTAKGFEKQLEASSISWGVSNSNVASGKPSFSTVNFMLPNGSHSPSFMLACAKGSRLDPVTITFTTNGSTVNKYIIITLNTAVIMSMQQSSDSSSRPTEDISIAFTKITFAEYVADATGKYSLSDTHNWDIAGNKGG